jgi:hypothetical protein
VRTSRAYLTVGFNGLVKQDPTTNYKFEARMTLQNMGSTPDYNVRYVARLGVLPIPLPNDFQLPTIDQNAPTGVIAPNQSFVFSSIADRIYSDEDANEVKNSFNKHLYVYGAISYDDVFGLSRHIHFCQAILWLKNDTFMAVNASAHNDSD